MVKRVILLGVPFVLLVVFAIIVVAQMPDNTNALPADGQARLDEYLQDAARSGRVRVQMAVRARKPWLFGKDMSSGAFGSSVHYQTEDYSSMLGPLPFPPDELWCVLLEREDDAIAETSYSVIFVGLHMDMYNADWVVHEAMTALSRPGALETLSLVGCDLGLDQLGPGNVNQ